MLVEQNVQSDAASPVTSPIEGATLFASWRADLPAAFVVFLVAVPLCLGIALASGAPLSAGIVSGVVGGLVVAAISRAPLLVSGPAAGLSAMAALSIQELGSFQAFLAAVVVAGLAQLVLSAIRAGVIGYFFPTSVIQGMLAAIGVLLILKQLPHAVGYHADPFGDESFHQTNDENTFTALDHALHVVDLQVVAISVLALALLVLWDRPWMKRARVVPGPLVAVLVGVGIDALLRAVAPARAVPDEHMVALPTDASVAALFGDFAGPDWAALGTATAWSIGLALGLVASLETLLSVEATDKIDPLKRRTPNDRELFAQGIGNVAAGLLGGLPITGVIVRSSANIDAGARGRLSAMVHGVLLLLAYLAFPQVLNAIPLASLAAILLYTGYKLARPALFRTAWRVGKEHFLPFVVTIVAILFTDLLVGIAIGMATGVFFMLLAYARADALILQSVPGAVLTRYRLPEHATFLGKASIAARLDALPPGSRVEIDGRQCVRVDHDVLEVLHAFEVTARDRGIDYRLVGVADTATTPTHH